MVPSVTRFVNYYHVSKVQELDKELNELNEKLANEKKQGQMVQERLKALFGCKRTYKEYTYSLRRRGFMRPNYKLDGLKSNMESNDDKIHGSSPSNVEFEIDLTKTGTPKDYLMWW
ncbi:hypothetical protein L1887_20934 [Cichorium endivia]|nr:hypothetical protein L1887_20934 [Cichorium endivia]